MNADEIIKNVQEIFPRLANIPIDEVIGIKERRRVGGDLRSIRKKGYS